MEFLTHDISWHVPHHVSSKIPWYNLRKATESLRKNWGQVRPGRGGAGHRNFAVREGCSAAMGR